MVHKIARYGWKKDLPDIRDIKYHERMPHEVVYRGLPPVQSLRAQCPPVYDQLQIGSCTANGWAGIVQFVAMKENLPDQSNPSRRFIYHKEMVLEGDCNGDNGAQVRTGGNVVSTVGWPDESIYPYSNNIADFLPSPPSNVWAAAKKDQVLTYMSLNQDINLFKSCIASGFPFVFGFTVYESFESPQVAKTGVVPMPASNESVLGGHCVVAVGYDDTRQLMECRNSWNTTWGDAGYFWMPYNYICNAQLASDFWTVRKEVE